MNLADEIATNVAKVRNNISDAARRSGRTAEQITLVAVTKYIDAEKTRLIVDAGCQQLGENRPQQLWEKAAALQDLTAICWHQIGHLQRNKVAKTLPLIHLLHSVDSVRLLKEVNRAAQSTGNIQPVLLEVNVSGDQSKHGWLPQEMAAVVDDLIAYAHVEVQGLMTMATLGGDTRVARRDFAALRDLRDDLQARVGDAARLDELSMGMSGDYEAAIEEGATIVRVGSAICR